MNARERFEQTRRAIIRLDEVHALIMYGCDDWQPPSVRTKSDKSDPTANKAIRNVDELEEKLASLRKEETELTDFIGTTLAIIKAVHDGFGEIYATLLEARYIDGKTWADIYELHAIKRTKGHYLIDVACDWVDSVGVSRLLRGETEI